MARQKGIIKLKGKVGDLSFYKTQDGHLAREKGGVEKSRIEKDPAFARTRENGAEFGSAASSGKLMRDALRTIAINASDNRVTSRLTKLMTDIKNEDTENIRGKRSVGDALVNVTAKALLKGFNFNNRAFLGSVLFKPYAVNIATGEIIINGLTPINDIAYPSGATHFSVKGAWAKIDFVNRVHKIELSDAFNAPIDATLNDVVLTPAAVLEIPNKVTPVFRRKLTPHFDLLF